MNQAAEAIKTMWAFASGMVDKYGMNGDDTMTDAEHQSWQSASALCANVFRSTESDMPENEIAEFMLRRIENGDLALEDIPVRLAQYGLMDPVDFVDEMRERMGLPNSQGDSCSSNRWYAVTGRIPEEDESCTLTFQASSRDEAVAMFIDDIWAMEPESSRNEDREYVEAVHGLPAFIDAVFVSETRIEIAE